MSRHLGALPLPEAVLHSRQFCPSGIQHFGIPHRIQTITSDGIYIDFSRMPENCVSYDAYINRISRGLKEDLGFIHKLAKESEKMLKATLTNDTRTMSRILNYAHDTESPILSYNSEIELSAVVNLVYLAARDKYRVEREDKAGEGYVDFIFYPERREDDCIILELKIDSTPEDAIQQIKNKQYALRFQGKPGEKPRYTGKIRAVGISYDRKTKKHFCKVEIL